MHKKQTYFTISLLLILPLMAWANNNKRFTDAFNDGANSGAKINQNVIESMSRAQAELKPNAEPTETKYYYATTENHDALQQQARAAADISTLDQVIKQSSTQRPKFNIAAEELHTKKVDDINTQDIFCLDGKCMNHGYQANTEYAATVSNLSGAIDASKQINQKNFLVFNGKSAMCRESMLGYYDCCNYDGWGVNWGLINCRDEEKQLAQARKEGLAVKVGRRCSLRTAGVCREHRQTYCIFDSKQARIIQEQGRAQQLHLNFGTAKNPNCSGITVEQMQHLNFSSIDFSEFFGDLQAKTKMPNAEADIARISTHIQEKYQAVVNKP